MKNCRACTRPCEASASRCPECGATFTSEESTVEFVSETGSFVAESFEAQSFPRYFPAEYWLLLGVALSAIGYSYTVVAVILLYHLFKHFRPYAAWELLLIAGGFGGVNLIKTFNLLSAHQAPIQFLEPFLVTNAAITLLFTRQRAWARLLFLYALLGMFIKPISAFLSDPMSFQVRDNLFTMVFLGLIVWLSGRWMARQKLASDPTNATSIFVLRKT